ncbi:MAG: hypothetical protein OQK78_08785, partial [Gammaproteobacteria bacterium]|nr:hypothetical protein [Gammaproteobacteria bacterium]
RQIVVQSLTVCIKPSVVLKPVVSTKGAVVDTNKITVLERVSISSVHVTNGSCSVMADHERRTVQAVTVHEITGLLHIKKVNSIHCFLVRAPSFIVTNDHTSAIETAQDVSN